MSEAARATLDRIAVEAAIAPPRVVEGARFGFRHRARLMVRGRASSPKVGIFREASHEVVDIPRCRVHHPLVNEVAAALRDAIRTTGVRPYVERAHAGTLRAVQIVVERASRSAQVVLVANATAFDGLDPLAERLAERLGASLGSLWWNGQPARTNTILGPHWRRWSGPEAVRESIGGVDVFFPPDAFGQSHLDLADALVRRVRDEVPDGARVAELYCGAGPIGLGLLGRVARLAFVESAPGAVRGLGLGLAARPAPERERAVVVAREAALALDALDGADVVIADPPRKGLDAAVSAALAAHPPERLVYVSCDLDSFRRDAAILASTGALRLATLEAWSLFPNTSHVETLSIWRARRAAASALDPAEGGMT